MESKKELKKRLKVVNSKLKKLRSIPKEDTKKSLELGNELLNEVSSLRSLEIAKYEPKLLKELNKSYDVLSLYVKNLKELEKINQKWLKKS